MKISLSLLCICILTFTFSCAQQGIDLTYNLLEISNLSKKQNISFQSNLLVKTNNNKALLLITNEIPIEQGSLNSPFIALSVSNSFANFGTNSSLFYKVKKNNTWSNWIQIYQDAHTSNFEQVYLPSNSAVIQFKIEGNNSSNLTLNAINYRLFFPGETQKVNQNQTVFQHKDLICNCPLPDIEYRNDWCPSGNCPENTNPTPTNFTHLVVHHSAGSNSSPDWAATVRSIWDYHTSNNGWNDIGYNYLIDPNGVIYEGRGNDVQGAHFSCMNSGAMGVCLLGDFQTATPPTAMINSLIKLMGWKACELNKDPRDSSYFAAATIDLINLCGHRDGNNLPNSCTITECPGNNVYDILGIIRNNIVNYSQNCTVANTYSNIVVLNMTATPSTIHVNEPTQLNVDFKNIGDADINENLNISFRVEGNEINTTSFNNLNVNESKTESIPYTFNTIDSYRYCVYIDAASNELLTNNNSYCVNLEVIAKPTNIHNIKVSEYNIYPNPAKNQLYIEGESFTEVEIYNPLGQLIKQEIASPIDINNLNKGIYFLKIKRDNLELNLNFFKE